MHLPPWSVQKVYEFIGVSALLPLTCKFTESFFIQLSFEEQQVTLYGELLQTQDAINL
jgi:hypothetical protein